MQETPITHPGVPQEQYHTLGRKTFWIFFLQRVHAAMVLLILAVALAVVQGQPFIKDVAGRDLTPYAGLATLCAFLLFALVFLITLFITWLIYKNYKFFLDDNSLKIKRGVLDREEVAIPYRQIQDVDIERDLAFQMLGLSRLVILTAGQEEEKADGDQSEGILPAMDKDLAEWLQRELLGRANVQKVVEENPAQGPGMGAGANPPGGAAK